MPQGGETRIGERRPLLLVVRSAGSTVHEETIREHLARHVARWWMPDAIVFLPELPLLGTGKVDKKTLKLQFGGVLGSA